MQAVEESRMGLMEDKVGKRVAGVLTGCSAAAANSRKCTALPLSWRHACRRQLC